jgi:alpha-L-fucosidase 2
MDGVNEDGLVVTGKSADYLGVEGAIRYRAQLQAFTEGGSMEVDGIDLIIENADTVILAIAAATNVVNYKDVSGNPEESVEKYLEQIRDKSAQHMFTDAIADHQSLFARVSMNLPMTDHSFLPTNRRMAGYATQTDPSLASLCYNFARYVLIASSREGTQPANLQGIWNEDMNPSWDSKYTTNINTEMNYWPVETGNLPECAEPLITMVKELSDQGSRVAREHYGAGGWVFHQNTDLWRVAAPMDGPCWGTFTTGGAWLCTQLYEHYLFNPEKESLQEIYPVIKGAVQFFMDFLIEHPNGLWLVTSPSTSPENPPSGPGYRYFFDEVTGSYYFTTICYGSTIDNQILTDLFRIFTESAEILDLDSEFADRVKQARARLVPPLVGKDGTLQEWTEDLEQLEDKHRHFSHMYGLYPGNVISVKTTPHLIDACKAVLEQRGDGGTGFSRAWKMALWARMYDGNRAAQIFKGYIEEQSYPQLFAKCFTPLQIDGTQGVAAGITEMLIQSHEGVIHLLPALPDEWSKGSFKGVCARGGFELGMNWDDGEITHAEIQSKFGLRCRINPGGEFKVLKNGRKVLVDTYEDGSIGFDTKAGELYTLLK